MIPPNMVSLTEENIAKVMQSFQGQKSDILLWQKDELGQKRHVQAARIILVEDGEILITTENIFIVYEESPVYVFHKGRQIVFKTTIKTLQPKQMRVQFPESLILPNIRLEERMDYLGQKIYLHFSHRQDVKMTDIDDLHKVQVVDVSENGISFKATKEKNFGLQMGDRIWVKLYDDEEPSEAIVKHLTFMRSGPLENFLQIGLRFQQTAT